MTIPVRGIPPLRRGGLHPHKEIFPYQERFKVYTVGETPLDSECPGTGGVGVGLYTLIDNNQLSSHRIVVYQAISRHLTVRDAKHQLPLVIHNLQEGGG